MLDQRLGGKRRADPVGLLGRAVARVEPRGHGQRALAQLVAQRGDRGRVPGTAHRRVAVPGLGDQPQRQRGRGGELLLRVRRRRRFQPAEVPLDEVQPAGVVPGQRAELEVAGQLLQLRRVVADRPVRLAVRTRRVLVPSDVDIGQQQLGQDEMGLLGAAERAAQHRFGHLHRLGVPAEPAQVRDLVARLAADAVGHLAARRRRPQPVLLGRGFPVADVPGEHRAVLVHRVHRVPGRAVPAFHVVEHGAGPLERHLRERGHRAGHVLEVPVQAVVPARIGLAAVVHRQAPGERHERLRGLTALLVGAGDEDAGGIAQRGRAEGVRFAEDGLQRGDLGATARQLVRGPQPIPHFLLFGGGGGHRDSSSGTACSSRPRNERFSRAASAGRTGCLPNSRAWP
ncbi:hypothetical protein [Amycolatopsis sp. NPDC021455]|uniref:hypothetical protein n=1 Tax=Amycolatopsis sp. NPDC021455 TaxID=3154901 RepID=UPI00340AA4AD